MWLGYGTVRLVSNSVSTQNVQTFQTKIHELDLGYEVREGTRGRVV